MYGKPKGGHYDHYKKLVIKNSFVIKRERRKIKGLVRKATAETTNPVHFLKI